MDNLWERINHLVPAPDCDTAEPEGIIMWRDVRAQPTEAELAAVDITVLSKTKDQRCEFMLQSFSQAVAVDVTYNSVIYQSGSRTRNNLSLALANFVSAGNPLPAGFKWIAKDNTQTSFTLTNIKELAEVVGDQWHTEFANYQAKKAEIRAVSTGDDTADIITVNAIEW